MRRLQRRFWAYVGLTPIKRAPKPTPKPPREKKIKHPYAYKREITAFGETHKLTEWAEILGMDYNKIYMRMYRGMTFEEAVTTKDKKICIGEQFTVKGETRTIREWAKVNGLTTWCIYARLERGYSVEDAIMMPKGGY